MCAHGDTVTVRVWVAADLSNTESAKWKDAEIDRCIAPLVEALQAADINMRSSCCGHGNGDGEILLADGRRLVIRVTSTANRGKKHRRVLPTGAVDHPWQAFLTARLNAILWFVDEFGYDDATIAQKLSMDLMQATLCRMTAEERAR